MSTGDRFYSDGLFWIRVCVAAVIFGFGCWIGGFNNRGFGQSGSRNPGITRELNECRRQLAQERTISAGLREHLERERTVTGELGRTIAQAGEDIGAALSAAGHAATTVSEVQAKVSLLADCLGDIKRRFDGLDYRPGN